MELTEVAPDLVCNAQRIEPSVSVVLTGSDFAPMPTDVLTPPPDLVLPEVTLEMSQDLGGDAASGTTLEFPAKTGEELSDNVSWESSEQMTVRVTEDPAVELQPGLYDVTVENPDQRASDTLEQGLAVVPPPSVDSLEPEPTALCVAQDPRQLTVNGANFLVVDEETPTVTLSPETGDGQHLTSSADECDAVPGTYAGGTVELCETLTSDLPQDLATGAYDVMVTSPEPASCFSSEEVSMAIVPPPSVDQDGITVVCLEQDQRLITISGGGFIRIGDDLPGVEITGGSLSAALSLEPDLGSLEGCQSVDGVTGVDSCQSFTITVDETELAPDDYTLVITNPQPAGCSTAEQALSIEPPPEVDTVVPSTVCEGGSRLSITGSGFQQGASVQLQCPEGKVVDAISVEVVSATELRAAIGSGIEVDETCDVVVANPDSCADEEPHEVVTGITGPFLFMADPFAIYNGVNTPVTLFLTTITTDSDGDLPDGAVTVVLNGQADGGSTYDAQVTNDYPNRAQFTVPTDQAPGVYDVVFEDYSGCMASLEQAFTVTDQDTVVIEQVVPPFGDTNVSTAVTILRGASGDAFEATPRVFLAPSDGSGEAILLDSVSLSGDDTLTAIVPAGTAPDEYDIIVVNPSGTVGVATASYTSVSDPPPVVEEVTPQSLVNDNTDDALSIRGTGFDSSEVSLRCVEQNRSSVAAPSVTSGSAACDDNGCEQTADVDASSLPDGAVCVVRVTNGDGSYGEFSAVGVTNPSLNLTDPQPGTDLNVARRALSSAAVKATSAARFVYAIGGDTGPSSADAPLASVEFAAVDVFGAMQDWVLAGAELQLNTARAFAGSATLGRYIYVFGGTDGSDALTSVERAMVLSPEEVPEILDVDIVLDDQGLDGGRWSYRVSAVISGADPDNPGGETLASSPLMVRLPVLEDDRKTQVTISWSAPLLASDPDAPLENVAGYRIYRTASPNQAAGADEVLLAELDIADLSSLQFTDDGSNTPAEDAAKPLPVGSTGRWHEVASLNTARMGPASALARDPDPDAQDTWYIYALLGKSGGSESSGTPMTSYEYLTVTVGDHDRQSVAGSWTEDDTDTASVARWQAGAWVVDASVWPGAGDDSHVYLGGGFDSDNDRDGTVEVAQVNADGSLAAFDIGPDDMSPVRTGYASVAVGTSEAAKLLLWGGRQANPMDNAMGAALISATEIENWNNEGLGMQEARYLFGSSVQSAFIFLVGGQTNGGGNVTNSTELVIW